MILTCFFFSYIGFYKKNRQITLLMPIYIAFITLIYSSDSNLLPDITSYTMNFELIDITSSFLEVKPNYFNYGNLFMALTMFIKIITGNVALYFLILASLIFAITAFSLNSILTTYYHEYMYDKKGIGINLCLIVSIWISYLGIVYSSIIIRAGLAMSLFLLSVSLFLRKRILASSMSMILSIMFHTSLIMPFLALLFLYKNNLSITGYYIWFFSIVGIWITRVSNYLNALFQSILLYFSSYLTDFNIYAMYYVNDIADNFYSKRNGYFLLLCFVFILFKPKKNPMYDLFLKMYMTGITFSYLGNNIKNVYRFSDLFMIFSVLLIYILLYDRRYISKNISILLFLALFTAQLLIAINFIGIKFY